MSKYIDKIRKLVDAINAVAKEEGLPISGAAVALDWDMDKIPAADANPRDLPSGVLAYPGPITLKNVFSVQRAMAGFMPSLTEMAINAVTKPSEDAPDEETTGDTQ